MTLSALVKLADTSVDMNGPEVKARIDSVRERQHVFDKELERKAQLKEPSNELLNRSCSL